MGEHCNDTNIPTTDETALECCEVYSTNCVVTAEAVPCLSVGKGTTLTKLFKRLCTALANITNRITAVENRPTLVEGAPLTYGIQGGIWKINTDGTPPASQFKLDTNDFSTVTKIEIDRNSPGSLGGLFTDYFRHLRGQVQLGGRLEVHIVNYDKPNDLSGVVSYPTAIYAISDIINGGGDIWEFIVDSTAENGGRLVADSGSIFDIAQGGTENFDKFTIHFNLSAPKKEFFTEYTVLATQSGVDAPTVSVLKNNLLPAGAWTRVSQGVFHFTSVGAFTDASKVEVLVPGIQNKWLTMTNLAFNTISAARLDANIVEVRTAAVTIVDGSYTAITPIEDNLLDDILSNTPITIRVWS